VKDPCHTKIHKVNLLVNDINNNPKKIKKCIFKTREIVLSLKGPRIRDQKIWRLAITMWQIVKRKTKDYMHGMIN
jgi:hypothetical protein